MIKFILSRLFIVYIVANMAVAAIVFLPWVRPRETVSGLLGRWLMTESGWKWRFARRVSLVVNRIYAWEPNHCVVTHEVEDQAHALLYSQYFDSDEPRTLQ